MGKSDIDQVWVTSSTNIPLWSICPSLSSHQSHKQKREREAKNNHPHPGHHQHNHMTNSSLRSIINNLWVDKVWFLAFFRTLCSFVTNFLCIQMLAPTHSTPDRGSPDLHWRQLSYWFLTGTLLANVHSIIRDYSNTITAPSCLTRNEEQRSTPFSSVQPRSV